MNREKIKEYKNANVILCLKNGEELKGNILEVWEGFEEIFL